MSQRQIREAISKVGPQPEAAFAIHLARWLPVSRLGQIFCGRVRGGAKGAKRGFWGCKAVDFSARRWYNGIRDQRSAHIVASSQ